MEASESHGMKTGDTATDETLRSPERPFDRTLYSDRIQAELLNLQSETELLFARLQALSRSQPASVG